MLPVHSLSDLEIYEPGDRARNLAKLLNCSELAAAVIDSRNAGDFGREMLDKPDLRRQLSELYLGNAASVAHKLWMKTVPGRKVFVYGDYDVDGISSTVTALELAQESGAQSAVYYIPDRRTEGYGLHLEHIKRIVESGFDTLIVVDCGSKDVEPVKLAQKLGMSVIIFDHHAVEGDVVKLDSLVNPQLDGNEESKTLCATAVLWCWAWQTHLLPERRLVGLLQLAALATIADCMPLEKLNRAITRNGLELMRRSPRRGLRELIHLLCPNDQDSMIDENRLSMRVIPCLNAAGRLQVADVAVNVLSGFGSDAEIHQSVCELLELNRRRRDLSTQICSFINQGISNGTSSRVFFNGDWPVGVLSAIASRLCNEHNMGFALAAPSGDGIRGSLRVPDGANAVEILKSLDSLLDAWGGHKYAAGFSVSVPNWPKLSLKLDNLLHGISIKKKREEVIEFYPSGITGGTWDEVLRIGPFGNGNPMPEFFVPLASNTTYVPLGKRGLHLKIQFDGMSLIAFNSAGQISGTQGIRGWLYRPRPNLWQGKISLQYIVDGIVV